MQAKLLIMGASPIWNSRMGEIWDAEISRASKLTFPHGNIHSIHVGNKQYDFDLKETEIGEKVYLMGFLADDDTAGKIAFEIQ